MSALIEDLHERNLLDSTLVVWMGEFGRTPKFEYLAAGRGPGRGHHGRAWSSVLMGGGIQGGQVIGRTDPIGGTVEDRPVSAPDFLATICQILGIDWKKTNDGPGGRTVRLTDKGSQPIRELIPA
jgi:arylsulfatase A-like enzyme